MNEQSRERERERATTSFLQYTLSDKSFRLTQFVSLIQIFVNFVQFIPNLCIKVLDKMSPSQNFVNVAQWDFI